jgi:ribosomal protein S18 acetylase RimI-like enzyme
MPTKSRIKVRPAIAEDMDALVRMNGVLQDLHAELYPGEFKGAVDQSLLRRAFAARLAHAGERTMIAEDDSGPLGYVVIEIQCRGDSPLKPARNRLYIHHIAVLPEARRNGVASALMAAVERLAIAEGVDQVELDYWAANADAEAFFQSRGFVPFNPRLRKQVRRRPQPPDRGEKKATS